MEAQQNVITPEVVAQSLSFEGYMALVREAVTQEKTTGLEQSAFLAELSKDNLVIKKRTYQTPFQPELVDLVKNLPQPQSWLVPTEGWCGDAAVHVPVLAALADQSPSVELRTILRTEQPDVMDAYLTNGEALQAELLHLIPEWTRASHA